MLTTQSLFTYFREFWLNFWQTRSWSLPKYYTSQMFAQANIRTEKTLLTCATMKMTLECLQSGISSQHLMARAPEMVLEAQWNTLQHVLAYRGRMRVRYWQLFEFGCSHIPGIKFHYTTAEDYERKSTPYSARDLCKLGQSQVRTKTVKVTGKVMEKNVTITCKSNILLLLVTLKCK